MTETLFAGPLELNGAELERANARYARLAFQPSLPTRDRTFACYPADAAPAAREPVALGRVQAHPDGAFELGGFWVAESARGRGLARRMVAHVLGHAPRAAPLWCIPFTHLAPFYTSFGFDPASRTDAPPSVRAKLEACEAQAREGVLATVCLLGRPPQLEHGPDAHPE